MGALRGLFRIWLGSVGVLLTFGGALGLALAYAPDLPGVAAGRDVAAQLLGLALPHLPVDADTDEVIEALAAVPWRFAVGPSGLLLAAVALRSGRRKDRRRGDEEQTAAGPSRADRRALRKTRREAGRIAKRGMPVEAAELCLAVDLLEDAADFFVKAGEFERAAEIRHDQDRFLESAEFYEKADLPESAGAIYAQQEEWERAAGAYVLADNLSVAAEMYEKAGDDRKAAECYERCDFPRYAAKAYIRCEQWLPAAECLEKVIAEEAPGMAADAQKHEDHRKLVKMTGNLYQRAGRLDRAQEVLAKGGIFAAAAELALQAGDLERAAELFVEGREAERAAAVLEQLGETERAARLLAEHHRDRGDSAEAARQFERAGELLEAGDLYRSIERYELAGECYERFGDGAQAAEMFGLAGDGARAAENYERAGHYAEAAGLHALAGDTQREAELLERAGECLRAGTIHLEAGRTEEAIGALQKVASEHVDFAAASALIGRIFRDQGKHSLAIAKLSEAVGDREIERESLEAFFCLATVYEANRDWQQAHDLYEKILAFDYHHEDTADRLERVRAELSRQPQVGSTAGGSTPGRYIIRGTLGRGGMGIVYRAEDTVLDRVVAFKVLPESLKENPEALRNFLREAKSAAQLNHPNIVTVYDAGEQDGAYYIAMEYVDGHTLKDIIKRRGKIAPRGIVHVVSQLSEALAFAHDKKIVHRDVKTANAMWTKDRKAKIMDFGLAKVIEEVRNHTTVVSGTPFYMSPEQTLGKNVDHRSDLYSLGVCVFEMATGRLPFTEGNLPYHHVHTPPPRPQDLEPELPDAIAAVIERCLQKDPADRYASAREIVEALRDAPIG